MSRSRVWFARGPALEIYENNISAGLDTLLAVIDPPEGVPFFLRLYMIGRDEDSASPVVMVCCADRKSRKDAEDLIRKSEILNIDRRFGLGVSAMLLESMGPEVLVTMVRTPDRSEEAQMELISSQKDEYQQSQAHNEAMVSTDGIIKIYEEHPFGPGARIKIVQISKEGVPLVHEATAGPIFQLGTDFYQITAGHGIRQNTAEETPHYSLSELDECEFDGQWDINDEIGTDRGSMTPEHCSPASSDNNTNRTSDSDVEVAEEEQKTQSSDSAASVAASLLQELPGSLASDAVLSTSSQGSRSGMGSAAAKYAPVSSPIHVKTEPEIGLMQQTVPNFGLVTGYAQMDLQLHNRDLDYVLLKLPTQSCLPDSTPYLKLETDFQNRVKDISHVGSQDTRIIVASRDGAISGYISPETISYKMRGFTRLQKLLPVRLEGILHEGHSGSAVVDASTGMLYGQVVLGSPGDTLAYCARSSDIFADIVSKLSQVPVLDKRRWEPNSLWFKDSAATRRTIQDTTDTTAKLTNVAKSEDKAAITEARGQRRRIMCTHCDENPDGFEEEHDLQRHEEAKHDVRKTSGSGRYSPGTDSFGAFDPLEKGYSPLWPQGKKRKRDMDTPPPSRSSSRKRTTRTFACPFYLHDKLRHNSCLCIKLNRVADTHQHVLGQAHNQVVHCPVCGITFTGRTAEARRQRDAHVQAATCEPSASPFDYPGITEDEEQRIREIARNTRTTQYTEVQRWYMIWDFLFPGEQRPDSPFLTEDVPDIQRVVDWTDAIFGTELWQELPNQPWTPNMRREEQKSGMYNFIHSFIAQARGLVGQNAAPAEDDSGADNSSIINVDKPAPSGVTTNLGVASLASFDTNLPVDTSGRAYFSPVSAPRSIQSQSSHTLGQMDSSTSKLPAGVSPTLFHALHDPAVAPLALQDCSAEDLDIHSGFNWLNSSINGWENFGNDKAEPDDNHTPPDEDELGGCH